MTTFSKLNQAFNSLFTKYVEADEFGDKFGDAFGLALMHNNTMAIMNLLAHAAVNKTKIGARDTIMGIIQTLPGLNSNVGNSDQQESDKEPVL